ncbi:unnamed protein product [Mytilus edulis]|uniref:Uncharacterized protein n=1 Tax=Mytilus edulis TaxID=6550 RepID=A0A8S3PS63_MYTED|nr:unnamed protein product [Mytilus edulis]
MALGIRKSPHIKDQLQVGLGYLEYTEGIERKKEQDQSHSEDRLYVGQDYSEYAERIKRIQDQDQSKSEACDLKGNVEGSYRLPSCDVSFVTVDDGRLFCTDRDILYCCDLNGAVIWEFRNEKLTGLHGVTVDGHRNVYVGGEWSNNVVAVSPNGKRCRVILTSADGIDAPRGIYFDKNENRLIVCNCNGNTVLVFNSKNDKMMEV